MNYEDEESAQEILKRAEDVASTVRHTARGVAQQVLNTAEEVAAVLKKQKEEMPSNTEIMQVLAQQNENFVKHTKEDIVQFTKIHEHLGRVATKEDIEELKLKLDPITDVYKAALLSKSFVTGFAAIIVAIGAIGGGFIWLINSAVNK